MGAPGCDIRKTPPHLNAPGGGQKRDPLIMPPATPPAQVKKRRAREPVFLHHGYSSRRVPSSVDRARKRLSPPSDAITADSLLDREELLIEEFRLVGEVSYRRRQEIELELCDLRRGLELLGAQRKA
jgi:hypothetical protein